MVFGEMICTTLNKDHKKRRELSWEIRKKIQHVNGKGCHTISKQTDVPTISIAHIIQKFKVPGTVANLPACDRKRKIIDKLNKRITQTVTKEPRTIPKN